MIDGMSTVRPLVQKEALITAVEMDTTTRRTRHKRTRMPTEGRLWQRESASHFDETFARRQTQCGNLTQAHNRDRVAGHGLQLQGNEESDGEKEGQAGRHAARDRGVRNILFIGDGLEG
jgi:hypothetical protein